MNSAQKFKQSTSQISQTDIISDNLLCLGMLIFDWLVCDHFFGNRTKLNKARKAYMTHICQLFIWKSKQKSRSHYEHDTVKVFLQIIVLPSFMTVLHGVWEIFNQVK